MVPLAHHDQHFSNSDNSKQQTTNNSPTHQYTGDKQNQPNSQPVTKEQSQSIVTLPPSSFKKKGQSCSTLSPLKSKSSYNRAMKSSTLHSKCPATPSRDSHSKNSLHYSCKSLDTSLSHRKHHTSSSKLANTSSLEPSQTGPRSRLPLSKAQTSSSTDLCRKSPLSESTQRVSTSSSSSFQHQETPSLNTTWTLHPLESSQSDSNSTLCKSKSQKESLLDCLCTSSIDNPKALSSSALNKLQKNDSPPNSSSLESNRTQNSPSPDCTPLKIPVSNSNNNVLSSPLSQAKSKRSNLPLHSACSSQSSPTCQPKPKAVVRGDPSMRAVGSSVSHPKIQNTTSPNDKHRAHQPPSTYPKPHVSGQRTSSPRPFGKNKNGSVSNSKPENKSSLEESVKPEPENEIPWPLDYSQPCIIKGGTVPDDVVNKIVNSISKSTIQKDLCRQILFRRMRGRPNPRPGPRLSSTYTVCLECASYIKSQCDHLTGKKDPRCATLFVIPTPESSSDGKLDVKIVLILSLPETCSSSFFQLPMKDSQPDDNIEGLNDNLDELEKITQFFPACESDLIQGLNTKRKCLALSPEDKDTSQEPEAIDWLFYVKNSNSIQSQNQVPAPSSSSSSSSCSFSSSSSSTGLPSQQSPCSDTTPVSVTGHSLAKVRSYHRLPPGVSWLEFIRGANSETTKVRQSTPIKTKRVRTHNTKSMKKGRRGPSTLLSYFQTKLQNEN